MLRTIMIGSSVFVQGVLLQKNPDGTVAVGYDNKVYTGYPVPAYAELAQGLIRTASVKPELA